MSLQLYTDKNQYMNQKEIFSSQYMPGIATVEIAKEPSVTDFLGCGVAITGSSCYLLNQMDEAQRTALLKDLYSKEGLGLSIARLTVGASDYSAELYSYDDVPFDTTLEHFSVQRDEAYIIPMIREILKINPDLYLYASPWSPPGWMKTGGSMCGGFMREQFVECYADYFVKFIQAYEEHGIRISAITPQNECETDQGGKMPACYWHPETEARFIRVLRRKLKENNLDVKIWMLDHNFSMVNRVMWSLDNIEGLKDSCDGVAFHYYSGAVEQTRIVREKYPDLKLYFTEGGPRLYDNYDTDWCKWGIMISRALKCGYSGFTGWNLMLDQMSWPDVGPFGCGGLVTKHSGTGELSYSGQYKAFRHIAPYISPDSKIYAITTDQYNSMFGYPFREQPTEGFFVENGKRESVLVLINPNDFKQQIQFSIDGQWRYADLNPESISTILI